MVEIIEEEDELLAIIIKSKDEVDDVSFFTPEEEPLQLGLINRAKGEKVSPHEHKDIQRSLSNTYEVIFVREGKVKTELYYSGNLVKEVILESGDTALLGNGGHGFEMIEDTEIVAVKQGPYLNREKDKKELS